MVGSPQAELALPTENTVILPALQNGHAAIYMTGETEYRDVFGRIWILDFRLRSQHYEGSRWILEPAEEGNRESQKK
jgi:hypothetical protein